MRVLFVSHMATRRGAPLLLLWLWSWLMQHERGIDPAVVLLTEGPLRPDFEALAPAAASSQPLFLDLGAFAVALHRLSADPDTHRRKGERSQVKVFQHSRIDGLAPQLLACMERAVSAGPRRG